MRVLVVSDSHRRTGVIEKIIESQPDVRHIFFLGDNVSDIEDLELIYPNKVFHIVCGNCDFGSMLPSSGIEIIGGKSIFYTHGHTFFVKYGISKLKELARNNNYDIVLYGHTHISQILYEDGIYFVNPGSAAASRQGRNSYAVIDITEKGIMPVIIEV